MGDVTVRPVEGGDRAAWLRMRAALWPDVPDDEHVADVDRFLASSREQAETFVAVAADGGPCGFLEAQLRSHAEGCTGSPVAYVEGWWVDPDRRRAGVGARLVEAACDWARGLGLAELASDAVLDNTTSHAAHAALGFEETARVVTFRKEL